MKLNKYILILFTILICFPSQPVTAQEQDIFAQDNLVAWCIVPFDGKKRGPAERAAMCAKLGLKKIAYDWREEHVPTFEQEILEYKKQGLEYFAFWAVHEEAFKLFEKHKMSPQVWYMIPQPAEGPQEQRVKQAAQACLPVLARAKKMGSKVGLYNHGGWAGDPPNMIAVCEYLKEQHQIDNVGVVYNQHHCHPRLDLFREDLKSMLPYLLCLNLNGTTRDGDQKGMKILPLGEGELDLKLLRIIKDSGYDGPVGIIGHTQDDVELRLRDNLNGLQWLRTQLNGKPAGPKPQPVTWSARPGPNSTPKNKTGLPAQIEGKFGKALNAKKGGVLAKTRVGIRDPNLTVECWVKLDSKSNFNIIAASETKSSLKHWELYTYAGTGYLSVYLPGIFGEIKSTTNVCDSKWHYVAMTFEKQFVKLYVDGKQVKEQPINYRKHADTTEGFAIGSLVEKTVGCDGAIDELRLSNEIKTIDGLPTKPFEVEDTTIGLWRFDQVKNKTYPDESKHQNHLTTQWKPVSGKPAIQTNTEKPAKITGHWGEDAIGFRWTEKDSQDNRWAFTKHGRFLASTIPLPGGFAEKGLVIKVGKKEEASVCYDLKRLNMMAAWTGGFLEFHEARFGLIRHLKPVGSMVFHNQSGLGWNSPKIKYRGLYSQGQRTVLEYSIGNTRVLESPWLEKKGKTFAVTREFHLGIIPSEIQVPISSFPGAKTPNRKTIGKSEMVAFKIDNDFIAAAVISDHPGHRIIAKNDQLWLTLGPSHKPTIAKVLVGRGQQSSILEFESLVTASKLTDVRALTEAGEKVWKEEITTSGVVSEQTGLGYAVDTIRLPFNNPYGSLFFVSGHDWLDNGDMVVATVHGEVWLAKNVNGNLRNVVWKRYATGLYQPLGIRVVNNRPHVLCRDQIVRLHDRDQNGEADFYECFYADVTTSTGVHDYVCCLETDANGNFYYIHANDGVVRVSPDGQTKEIVATGFRNPNGMGVRSDGLVTAAPQEGEWTPASAVCEVIQGRHYGYRGPKPKTGESPLGYEKPLVFLPRLVDNSSGGQFWSDSDQWGIFKNQLFHLSYGKCTMHLVLRDEIYSKDGNNLLTTQGAIVPFPFTFESGVCRGRMSPHDGQLYVSGLKGWTTTAVRDGSLQRVRLLEPANTFCPSGYEVYDNGIKFVFSQPLDPKSVTSSSFSVQAWNYRYSKNYGSPEFKISNPNQQGRDQWLVNSVRLLDQNRALFLEIPELNIADQLAVAIDVKSQTQRFDSLIYATIKQKRNTSMAPGQPFNSSLAEFERTLQNGVYVKSHECFKSSLDLFEPGNTVLEKARIKNGVDPTRGVSLVTFLKIDAPGTVLTLKTGKETFGAYRISPLTDKVSVKGSFAGEVKRNSVEKIPLGLDGGYCRIELDLKATSGDMQSQWSWSSDRFSVEPIPSKSLFFKSSWAEMQNRKGQFGNRFLEASQLISDNKCLRCHDLGQASNTAKSAQAGDHVSFSAPNLAGIASRRTSKYLFQKILAPHFEEHGAEMPSLFDTDNPDHLRIVNDLVAFLAKNELQKETKGQAKGKAINEKKVAAGERLFEQLGCVGCHHLPIENTEDKFDRISLKFTRNKFSAEGLAQFLLDPHKHAPHRKMGNFGLTRTEAESLTQFIQKHSNSEIENAIPITAGNPVRGKELFAQAGCVNCHQTSHDFSVPWFVLSDTEKSCLSVANKTSENKPYPRFDMTDDQKELLAYHLNEFKAGPNFTRASIDEAVGSIPPWKQVSKLTSTLRCNACHSIDSSQAILPEIIFEEGVVGLNPEQLPDLTQIGNKLNAAWMERLLSGRSQTRSRPWLKTRMPSFGAYSSILAQGFAHRSGFDENDKKELKADPKLAELGYRLTAQNGGLDCRQCHGVGNLPPRGDEKTQIVLGVNFSMATDRLRKEYYDRWMRDPLRIDPQTKMPKYSVDGKSTKIKEILGGHADKQYDALWHYLISVGHPNLQKK